MPRLAAIATAVPDHVLDGDLAAALAARLFADDLARLGAVHANAGIRRRHTCVPPDWFLREHGWAERSALFQENALLLGERAARHCLARASIAADEIDAVVAVSTTGICTPSLDALLAARLGLRPDVARLPVFGFGCAGGVLGLARAGALAKASPGSKVLLVVVELCSLTFRPGDRSAANMVATALFGDGAAACLVSTALPGPRLAAWGEHTWPDSLDVMGWRVEDDGLGVVFSRDIPALVAGGLAGPMADWLGRHGLGPEHVDRYLCHPGGAKVVTALEAALGLANGTLADERAVLTGYGNMSAATVLFVLDRAWGRPWPDRSVAVALGPGFSAGFLLLEKP
ncbi:type III polyketide synthase [Magnetospirillum sp. UT-4]|uniref:type III polyketide synthase n=1 Tax=Magnetospirillum sp. UT-4 TaxID=2681467 RepID=UPI00137F4C8A|nr:type III polyketide synthase [Magnetospirillum sp. UT-4]CAA7616069.1 putative chalcone synthase [Magnetospirillum sp. UT-4]